MANPLARVIMDNIAKKSQGGYVNKNNRIDGGNLTRQDENLIKNIIYQERKVESNRFTQKRVTLEELARMVRGQ
ncbi:MAG: hypothetical protein GX069_01015 [Tissierellia bacterium]|nr:hypothetical protein [Tissierellia bacterium]